MGRLAFRSGDSQRAIEWAERALALTETRALDSGDPDARREAAEVVSHACNTLGVALARTDRPREAVAHIERSIEVALGERLLQAACRGYTNLGILYSTLDPPRGISTCLEGLETAKRIGDLGVQSRLYANLAVAYWRVDGPLRGGGHRSRAGRHRAGPSARPARPSRGAPDRARSDLPVPRRLAARARVLPRSPRLVEATREPQLMFPCYDGLATLHLDLGDEAEAERYLVLAQEVCEQAGLEPDSLVLLPFLG
jgi:tetratricopeptide (TPR) repeat protein